MRVRSMFVLLAVLVGLLVSPSTSLSSAQGGWEDLPGPLRSGGGQVRARAAAALELYGTFHAMGVIVTIAAADDPDGDATATVEYRTGGEPYRAGFPPSRVGDTRFVGSLFWLEPGTSYDVRVTFSDPDGGPLDGTTVASTASTRGEIAIPAPNHSYAVSPTGSGTACSQASPCSLEEGLDQAQPGDEVVLRDGVYYQGDISLPRSGTSGAPIVIRGYDGETPVLDGADPDTFTWMAYGGGVYYTTVNAADTHLVLANGQRLFPYNSLTNLQSLSRGNTPGFTTSETTLYVHLAGDADPNGVTMTVSRHSSAFTVEWQDYVYFVNLTFRHYGQGDYAKAIFLNNASDNLVQGCTFASNDVGIGLKRDSHRNVIQDNAFYDTIFDWPWADIKDVGGLEDGGVVFYAYPFTGRGTIVRRNTFHDDFDGFSACPEETEAVTNETDVYENLVYRVGDDGMETDGRCSNVRIWGNTFHDVLMGVSLAPVYDGPVYAIRNLIYRTGVGNSGSPGSPFKFNSGYGQSGPMYLFHNTADAALPGNNGIDIKEPGTWEIIYARNNVWSGTDYALNNYNETQPIDFDYDDLYTTTPGEFVYWGSGPDRHMRDLATFQSLTGQEPHGLNVEPGFAGAGSGDYTLDPASDLIDAGVVIPGINADYAGVAPDVGAYEYQGYGFILTASPSARAVAPGGVAFYILSVQSLGGFDATVNLSTASPSPSLLLSLAPTAVSPPGQATLTVTDTHAGPTLMPGLWFHIPVTATGGGDTQTVRAGLLVGGVRVYLPSILTIYGP
jgi:parallel beta-helix repeat protein